MRHNSMSYVKRNSYEENHKVIIEGKIHENNSKSDVYNMLLKYKV